ncbi:MAG: hypothetical protein WAN48_10300 [Actinomycetes bacterium]
MDSAPDDPMPHTARARGRHRRAAARRFVPARVLVLAVVAAVVVAAVGAAAVTASLVRDDPAPTPTATPPSPSPDRSSSSPQAASQVEVRREVQVNGTTVTVDEQYTVASGDDIALAPRTASSDPALGVKALRTVAQDGTEAPFTEPVLVSTGRSLSVRGVYELRYCPDLVPLAWPTTTTVRGAAFTVDVVRSDEPLRNASAVCPRATSQAVDDPRLTVTRFAASGRSALVRLLWRGPKPALVRGVGAPGGFPLDGVGRGCGSGCVARLAPGVPTGIEVRPVDGCPMRASGSDRLPLLVEVGSSSRIVRVDAAGLGRWFARAC